MPSSTRSPLPISYRNRQSIVRGNIPEQEPGTVTFSWENFLNNAHEYFQPILSPSQAYPAPLGALDRLGHRGLILWLCWLVVRLRESDGKSPRVRFALLVAAWVLLQVIISLPMCGDAPSTRLPRGSFIALDTFFSISAAWIVVHTLRRFRPFVALLFAAAVLAMQVPVASQHRMLNRLTQTRETRPPGSSSNDSVKSAS